MLKRQELLGYFQALLTPEAFDDYAPNGLQIEGKEQISRVAFSVSATQESLRAAIAWQADALIVHHGVLWKHQGVRPITGPWGERIRLALNHEINLVAYHLPLDGHSEVGNAAALAQALSLTSLEPFGMYKKCATGIKGRLPTPMSAESLQQKLQNLLQHPVTLASHDVHALVQSLGIITGGANNEWTHASKDGLDAYITGEISEYNWHDAREAGLHYFACGHHATEKPGTLALMKRFKRDHPQLETQFFDSANPA